MDPNLAVLCFSFEHGRREERTSEASPRRGAGEAMTAPIRQSLRPLYSRVPVLGLQSPKETPIVAVYDQRCLSSFNIHVLQV
jgi:hypothetical protein